MWLVRENHNKLTLINFIDTCQSLATLGFLLSKIFSCVAIHTGSTCYSTGVSYLATKLMQTTAA